MAKRGFGELELSILKRVRELGRVSVRSIYERLGGQGSYTTIMTVMSRLAEKGELKREKQGKQYVYWIEPQHVPPFKNILKRIQDRIFGGKPLEMMSYLLESDPQISNEELEEIERLIKKRKAQKRNG